MAQKKKIAVKAKPTKAAVRTTKSSHAAPPVRATRTSPTASKTQPAKATAKAPVAAAPKAAKPAKSAIAAPAKDVKSSAKVNAPVQKMAAPTKPGAKTGTPASSKPVQSKLGQPKLDQAKPAAVKASAASAGKVPAGPAAAASQLAHKPVPAAAHGRKAGATAAAFAAHRARAAGAVPAAPQRAVPAALAKTSAAKITAPARPAEVPPASPKAIAEKAAAARQIMVAQKKPVSQRHGFKTNEFIVYPAHGVGRIIGIEEQEIAGMSLELFVINFEKEKLTLRVPTGKLESVGMRKLADDGIVGKAMEILKGRARIKRTMWSRRAQEYVAKINSGDLISIAEVVRDLYRSEAQPEQSYSERQLYEDALDRMAREIAAVEKLDERGAVQRITDVLSKSARGRRAAEAEAEAEASGSVKAA